MNRPKIIAFAVATVIALGAGYSVMSGGDKEAPKQNIPKADAAPGLLRFPAGAPQLSQIRLEQASVAPVPLAEPLAARIGYNEDTTVRFFSPVAGRVTKIAVQIGDTVKTGQPLIILDAPELGSAFADNTKATAELAQKHAAIERARMLYQGEAISKRELEAAETNWTQAQAESQRARLRLANLTRGAATSGEALVLRTPINGIVAERNASPGLEARPDTERPLLVVADLRRLTVTIDLPEKDLDKVAVGQKIQIEANAYPDRVFDGRIERIAPVVDPATRRVQVRSFVDNEDNALKPEMYVRVSLIADSNHEAVRLPLSALLVEGVRNYVFVEKEPGVLEKREVAVDLQTREFAYISKGVTGGEKVVASGALLLNAELASGSQGR